MSSFNRIFYNGTDDIGWAPITHMVGLAADFFQAEKYDYYSAKSRFVDRIKASFQKMSNGKHKYLDLFVLRAPNEVLKIVSLDEFREVGRIRVLWVIDSFWTDRFPKPVKRILSGFDVVAHTRYADHDFYRDLVGDRALYLGWGSDALGLGQWRGERAWDVLRVGRQPPSWNSDSKTLDACNALGLNYHGRPPHSLDPLTGYKDLLNNWYSKTKVVIAHSNLTSNEKYIHQKKDYITARWVDSLACGATVAGVPPNQDLHSINWPEALLKFDSPDLQENLILIRKYIDDWSPEIARINAEKSLKLLDWRWRFFNLACKAEIESDRITDVMEDLNNAIENVKKPTSRVFG